MAELDRNQAGIRDRGELLGHPKGLWVLAGTEFWDRVSFHGMLAMLVLYMTGDLLPDHARTATILGFAAYRRAVETMTGPLSDSALAVQTFGFYMAAITGMPLVGGWIGDRFTGRRIAVTLGAVLMTAGHFAFAFDQTFLIALILLILGAALLRGNLSPQIKSLYPGNDPRETNAFQIYYVGVSSGATVAPIAIGAIAAVWGWHVGFATAGFGMLIGLLFYLAGQRTLPSGDRPGGTGPTREALPPLTQDERRRVLGLLLLWPLVVCFWIAQAQVWDVYSIWLRDHVDMHVGSFAVPVPWMQSLDGLAPSIFAIMLMAFWGWQARRGKEPDQFGKLAIGMFIFAAGVLILAATPLLADARGRGPLFMPVLFHVVTNLGAIYFAPVILAIYASRSPAQWRGTLVGISTLAVSAASLIAGRMGVLYERIAPPEFWLINAAICAGGGLALMVATPIFKRMLGRETAGSGAGVEPLVPKFDPEPAN